MRAGQIDLSDLSMPIVLRPSARLSDEGLMRFSEQNRPFKIERNKEGDLTIMTPVGGIGGTHEKYVIIQFGKWAELNRTGMDFGSNTGFNIPDGSCLSPDTAWITLDRWNNLTLDEQEGYPPLCPDFIVEVRSKSDARKIVEAKMLTWMENGAKLAWFIDPIAKTITIYRQNQPVESLDQPETITADGPVAGFELRCAPLWASR